MTDCSTSYINKIPKTFVYHRLFTNDIGIIKIFDIKIDVLDNNLYSGSSEFFYFVSGYELVGFSYLQNFEC